MFRYLLILGHPSGRFNRYGDPRVKCHIDPTIDHVSKVKITTCMPPSNDRNAMAYNGIVEVKVSGGKIYQLEYITREERRRDKVTAQPEDKLHL
jgi:hypothetical protein